MGHIKEPKGVDFIMQTEPLTNDERAGISEFIHNYKAKQKAKPGTHKKSTETKTRRKTSA